MEMEIELGTQPFGWEIGKRLAYFTVRYDLSSALSQFRVPGSEFGVNAKRDTLNSKLLSVANRHKASAVPAQTGALAELTSRNVSRISETLLGWAYGRMD
jgi:hypothetical protein